MQATKECEQTPFCPGESICIKGEIRAISYKSSLLYLEQGATHLALAVYTWHRLQGAHWVLEAVESICTEKAPWIDNRKTNQTTKSRKKSRALELQQINFLAQNLISHDRHSKWECVTLWEGSERFSAPFFQEFRIIRECDSSVSGSAPIECHLASRVLRMAWDISGPYRQMGNDAFLLSDWNYRVSETKRISMTCRQHKAQYQSFHRRGIVAGVLTDATSSLRSLLSYRTNANEPTKSPITWSAE